MGKEEKWLGLACFIAGFCCALFIGALLWTADQPPPAPFEEWVGEDFEDNPDWLLAVPSTTPRERRLVVCPSADGMDLDDPDGCITSDEAKLIRAFWDIQRDNQQEE